VTVNCLSQKDKDYFQVLAFACKNGQVLKVGSSELKQVEKYFNIKVVSSNKVEPGEFLFTEALDNLEQEELPNYLYYSIPFLESKPMVWTSDEYEMISSIGVKAAIFSDLKDNADKCILIEDDLMEIWKEVHTKFSLRKKEHLKALGKLTDVESTNWRKFGFQSSSINQVSRDLGPPSGLLVLQFINWMNEKYPTEYELWVSDCWKENIAPVPMANNILGQKFMKAFLGQTNLTENITNGERFKNWLFQETKEMLMKKKIQKSYLGFLFVLYGMGLARLVSFGWVIFLPFYKIIFSE